MADLSVEDTRSNCLQSSSFPSSLWRPKFGNVTLPIHPHYKAVLPMSRCVCSDSGKFETSNAVVLDSMNLYFGEQDRNHKGIMVLGHWEKCY
ncbi:unnamed protein product [Brassica rapa]|uniref:Uncharacterized protein n=1 Tax=Brassica campestris TaxID=3711 RepID=A0A3P5Y0W0_BRACM|nr:unnamed protein product [Brassica rapa]VDC60766.1 unnamed protein product [Brassica rapa]